MELLVGLSAAVLLIGVFVALWHSHRRKVEIGASGPSEAEQSSPRLELAEREGIVLIPLPTRRKEAIALGRTEALDAFENSGLGRRSGVRSPGPIPQVVRQLVNAGGQDATRRADQQIDAGRIVALSAETMEHLKSGSAARDKSGQVLGLVRGKTGKLAHVMRLDMAGAKAVTASNAATLAMTAALSQQLEHIEEQLTEIRETLEGLVADVDRERLARAVAANVDLQQIADSIRRHGEMTEADRIDLAAISLPVTTGVVEAEFKLDEILARTDTELNRAKRQDELERLHGKERLEYWLALRVEVELAQTRRDLLHLYWEQTRHPDSAAALAEEVRTAITTRQQRMQHLGELLRRLADPEPRTRLDPLRQLSRLRLKQQQQAVELLLSKHGDAFAGPEHDPFALIGEAEAGDAVMLIEAPNPS